MTFARHHHPNPAREQWDRCERWYGRFLAAAEAKDTDVEDYALVVLHHCWTMHDWLIRGLHSPQPVAERENTYRQAEVEALFQAPELRVCRIFSTATKHLDVDAIQIGAYDGIILREYDWPNGGTLLIALADGKHDVFELCKNAMARIRMFLEAHGWPLPITRLAPDIMPA